MVHRDVVLLHKFSNLWVRFNLPSGFRGLPPREAVPLRRDLSSPFLPQISPVFGRMTSLFVADEAFVVSDVLRSFTRGEVDFVYVHGIRVGVRGSAGQRNVAVSPSSEFPELYHVSVKLSCFVQPLFPFPTGLSVWEGSRGYHDSELLGYPPLESIYEDAVIVDSAARLGQFEGGGVLVEVSIELVHVKRIDSLAGPILEVFRNEGFFKGSA